MISHAPSAHADAGRVPVLVELFTSEGCSSCPPADATLARLVEEQPVPGARIVALGEHVDYWDDLGWRDPFSSRAFSERQQAYVQALRVASPYTPQLVVGGRLEALGSDPAAARAAIAAAARSAEGAIALRLEPQRGGRVVLNIDASWRAGVDADVFVAAVRDRATTKVSGGENAGRTLTHVAIVRSMAVVGVGKGAFSGRASLDDLRGADRAVVFVQERWGGPVHAVDSIRLPSTAAAPREHQVSGGDRDAVP